MNQHLFTASLAEQHRAELMAAARNAREYRPAKNGRTRGFRLRARRGPVPVVRPATPVAPVAPVATAV